MDITRHIQILFHRVVSRYTISDALIFALSFKHASPFKLKQHETVLHTD